MLVLLDCLKTRSIYNSIGAHTRMVIHPGGFVLLSVFTLLVLSFMHSTRKYVAYRQSDVLRLNSAALLVGGGSLRFSLDDDGTTHSCVPSFSYRELRD